MANYYSFTRTNYFAVKDEEKLRQIIDSCQSTEERLSIWKKTVDNQTLFAFGCYGAISGLLVENEDEDGEGDLNALYDALQQIVADDHAVIITEVGHEKLCYLVGDCTVVTSKGRLFANLRETGLVKARQLLGDPQYQPPMEY